MRERRVRAVRAAVLTVTVSVAAAGVVGEPSRVAVAWGLAGDDAPRGASYRGAADPGPQESDADSVPPPEAGAEGTLVVLERGGGTAAWLDVATGEVIARRRVGVGPHDLDVADDGRTGVAADLGGRYLTAVDLGESRVVARHDLGALAAASGVRISADGSLAWIALASRPEILELDLRSGTVARSWSAGDDPAAVLVVTPDERKLYASSPAAGAVAVIDRRRGSSSLVPTGAGAEGIDISPWGHEVWVANALDGTVSVIDLSRDTVTATFDSGGGFPLRVQFAPAGNRVWITHNSSGTITVFNALSRQQIAEIELGSAVLDVFFRPDGQRAWVTAPRRDVVFEIDVAERRVIREIPVGESPGALVWLPPVARPAARPRATDIGAIDDGEPRLVIEPLRGPLLQVSVVRVENGATITVNAVASIGDDGVLLVDTLTSAWVEMLLARLETLSRLPVRAIVNTHAHRDHTGGNAAVVEFANRTWPRAGAPAIIAQGSVAGRVASRQPIPGEDRLRDPLPPAGRPTASFTTSRRLRFNGEDVRITHVPAAHTDGDSVVHFTGSGVASVGDLFYSIGDTVGAGAVPEHGGDLQGLARGIRDLADQLPSGTVIVPGHGPVRTVAELRAYAALLDGTATYVRAGVRDGRSLDELVRAGLPEAVRGVAVAGWVLAERELIEAAHRVESGGG